MDVAGITYLLRTFGLITYSPYGAALLASRRSMARLVWPRHLRRESSVNLVPDVDLPWVGPAMVESTGEKSLGWPDAEGIDNKTASKADASSSPSVLSSSSPCAHATALETSCSKSKLASAVGVMMR